MTIVQHDTELERYYHPENFQSLSQGFCKYSLYDMAVKECCMCQEGLCSSCGYTIGDAIFCNECYTDGE